MQPSQKLVLIKVVHTMIWLFFVTAIFYVVCSAIVDHVTPWTWVAIGLVLCEGLVLLLFRMFCPLTVLARRYSDSDRDNFDIYLPEWLARYNKIIFTTIFLIGVAIVLYRVL